MPVSTKINLQVFLFTYLDDVDVDNIGKMESDEGNEDEFFGGVVNAGDSRFVGCRDGTATEISFDHKPEDTLEWDSIENAGGRFTADGCANGGLNLFRAIGDHEHHSNVNGDQDGIPNDLDTDDGTDGILGAEDLFIDIEADGP